MRIPIVLGKRAEEGQDSWVSWVDAGVTGLGVNVGLVVDFATGPIGVIVTVNVQLCKWGSSRDDISDSTTVIRVRRDAKAAVRVRRD